MKQTLVSDKELQSVLPPLFMEITSRELYNIYIISATDEPHPISVADSAREVTRTDIEHGEGG